MRDLSKTHDTNSSVMWHSDFDLNRAFNSSKPKKKNIKLMSQNDMLSGESKEKVFFFFSFRLNKNNKYLREVH